MFVKSARAQNFTGVKGVRRRYLGTSYKKIRFNQPPLKLNFTYWVTSKIAFSQRLSEIFLDFGQSIMG